MANLNLNINGAGKQQSPCSILKKAVLSLGRIEGNVWQSIKGDQYREPRLGRAIALNGDDNYLDSKEKLIGQTPIFVKFTGLTLKFFSDYNGILGSGPHSGGTKGIMFRTYINSGALQCYIGDGESLQAITTTLIPPLNDPFDLSFAWSGRSGDDVIVTLNEISESHQVNIEWEGESTSNLILFSRLPIHNNSEGFCQAIELDYNNKGTAVYHLEQESGNTLYSSKTGHTLEIKGALDGVHIPDTGKTYSKANDVGYGFNHANPNVLIPIDQETSTTVIPCDKVYKGQAALNAKMDGFPMLEFNGDDNAIDLGELGTITEFEFETYMHVDNTEGTQACLGIGNSLSTRTAFVGTNGSGYGCGIFFDDDTYIIAQIQETLATETFKLNVSYVGGVFNVKKNGTEMYSVYHNKTLFTLDTLVTYIGGIAWSPSYNHKGWIAYSKMSINGQPVFDIPFVQKYGRKVHNVIDGTELEMPGAIPTWGTQLVFDDLGSRGFSLDNDNKVVNGTFNSDTDWIKSQASISGGVATLSAVGAGDPRIEQDVPLIIGESYSLFVSYSNVKQVSESRIIIGGVSNGWSNVTEGILRYDFVATTTGNLLIQCNQVNGNGFDVDSVTLLLSRYLPASATNPTLDVLGDPLTNSPALNKKGEVVGLNNSGTKLKFPLAPELINADVDNVLFEPPFLKVVDDNFDDNTIQGWSKINTSGEVTELSNVNKALQIHNSVTGISGSRPIIYSSLHTLNAGSKYRVIFHTEGIEGTAILKGVFDGSTVVYLNHELEPDVIYIFDIDILVTQSRFTMYMDGTNLFKINIGKVEVLDLSQPIPVTAKTLTYDDIPTDISKNIFANEMVPDKNKQQLTVLESDPTNKEISQITKCQNKTS